MPIMSINPSLTFEIWAIDFVEPFPRPRYKTSARYIIIAVEYVTKWEQVEPIESCTKKVASKFTYKNIITRFGCPITLFNDRGTHFINQTMETLTKEYMINQHKGSSYHPWVNGVIESFNKTLTKGLTKISNLDKNDWDDKIPAIL